MVDITIKIDASKVIGNFEKLAKDFPKATVSALNTLAQQARTVADEEIRKIYNVNKHELKKKDPTTLKSWLGYTKANITTLRASVIGRGVGLPIKYFNAKQTKEGVTFQLKTSGKIRTIRGAFGPKIKRLGKHVFQRLGKERLPIGSKATGKQHPLYTTGVSRMLRNVSVSKAISDYMYAHFGRIFTHEIEWWKR